MAAAAAMGLPPFGLFYTELTVLRESKKVDLLTKVKLYDGQDVTEQSAMEKPVVVIAQVTPDCKSRRNRFSPPNEPVARSLALLWKST